MRSTPFFRAMTTTYATSGMAAIPLALFLTFGFISMAVLSTKRNQNQLQHVKKRLQSEKSSQLAAMSSALIRQMFQSNILEMQMNPSTNQAQPVIRQRVPGLPLAPQQTPRPQVSGVRIANGGIIELKIPDHECVFSNASCRSLPIQNREVKVLVKMEALPATPDFIKAKIAVEYSPGKYVNLPEKLLPTPYST